MRMVGGSAMEPGVSTMTGMSGMTGFSKGLGRISNWPLVKLIW